MTFDDMTNTIIVRDAVIARLTIENFNYRDMIVALEQKVKELEKDATEET